MEDQKPKIKIAPIRTYAQDLTTAREQRKGGQPAHVLSTPNQPAVAKKPEVNSAANLPTKTSLPPKVFARSNKTTPVTHQAISPQDTLDALAKNELKNKTPKTTVPSGIEKDTASFVTENEDAAAATVITDTKKDRFKLFPTLFASFKNWFAEKRRAKARSKTPRYTVAETSRRKGVIQKATSSTGKTASADFASIQERIRKRKLAEANANKTPNTTWSANTESGFLLLEAPEETEVVAPVVQNIVMVPKKSARTIEPSPRPLSRTSVQGSMAEPTGPSGFEDPAYLAKTAPTVAVKPEPVKPVISPISIKAKPAEIEVTTLEPKVVVEETPEETPAPEETSVSPLPPPTNKYLFLRFDTNTSAMFVSLITISILAFGTYLYQNLTPIAPIEVFESEPKLFPESELVKINLGAFTQVDLVTKLLPLRDDVTRLTEIAINFNAIELDPVDSLTLIAKNLPPDFTHSLTLARPGYSGERVPFLALEMTDSTIALGGLLAWEQTLYSDFMTVFSTYINSPTASRFIDASLAGVDVRVLKNTAGEEVLLYGILNNTILITTDSLTFAALATVINK